MNDIKISEMIQMQKDLYEVNKDTWMRPQPETAKLSFLWMMEEIGECISIIKKKGDDKIMNDPEVRNHFVEEMVDVFMFANQILLKYNVSPEEISEIFKLKHEKNMNRNFKEEYKDK